MDFQRLTVFQAVARRLSFSRAADELNLSQPAVSKHIQLLEAELGVRLLHRVGRRVELTDAGHIVADYAQRVSGLTEDMRRVLGELEGLQRGYLRLGASTTPGLYLLPETLARFRMRYPGVETTLAITNSADVTRRVRAGELDLGFVGAPAEAPGLQVRAFEGDEIVLIVPAGHTLARQRAFTSDLLARETLIVREAGSATRQIAEANLVRLGLSPRRVLEMSGCEAVKRVVSAGLGVAFVSRYAIALELAHRLVSVPEIPELHFSRQLFLIARKDARPSAASLAFLALMQKGKVRQGGPDR
ncbi:MAG TPA: selenium metabolism-associated LysR family transcriptional regulator [Anaerolineales bacterium]|nr:selenium metabolism-associated LysR family transcriptional regulator [Anaerolineales bacterium]